MATRCTCHTIRENASGVSYSYAILGVLCPDCEAAIDREEYQDWLDSLTETERIAERWSNAVARARYYPARPGSRHRDAPPF